MTSRSGMPSQLGPFKIAGWDWLGNYFQKWENLASTLAEKLQAWARQHGARGRSPVVERVILEAKDREGQKLFLSFWVCADPSDPTKAVLIFQEGERDAGY
jgi:hypothetical protein